MMSIRKDAVERAIEALADGRLILIQDDLKRENEGDLVGAASRVTSQMINFMVTKGRGLVCQPITEETARRLGLGPQAEVNTESHGTAFTVSVDAARGISTGISAADRALTARILADPDAAPEQLCRPGHMFPIVARSGGVLERPGHTEASIDLVRAAGLEPSGLICEVLSADGSMARGEELARLADEWEMPLVTVGAIIDYRRGVGGG